MAPAAGKLNNMLGENISGVFFTPDDITGAAFKDEEIGKQTVYQLSFQLRAEGLTLRRLKILEMSFLKQIHLFLSGNITMC